MVGDLRTRASAEDERVQRGWFAGREVGARSHFCGIRSIALPSRVWLGQGAQVRIFISSNTWFCLILGVGLAACSTETASLRNDTQAGDDKEVNQPGARESARTGSGDRPRPLSSAEGQPGGSLGDSSVDDPTGGVTAVVDAGSADLGTGDQPVDPVIDGDPQERGDAGESDVGPGESDGDVGEDPGQDEVDAGSPSDGGADEGDPEPNDPEPDEDETANCGKIKCDCTFNGIQLWGRVEIVDAFADITVQEVDAFADLDVKEVTAFADECGEWEIVDAFGDFSVQMVSAFGDFDVRFVDNFPGVP